MGARRPEGKKRELDRLLLKAWGIYCVYGSYDSTIRTHTGSKVRLEMEVIYAIQVESLSSSGLKMLDVKVGKTTNLKSTLSQYERSHREVKTMDLWKPNEGMTLSKCERGVQNIAEQYAYERKGEVFVFLQDSYKEFSDSVSQLLVPTAEIRARSKEPKEKSKGKLESYTGKTPKLIKFRGKEFEVDTWREMVKILAREISEKTEDFSRVVEIRGRENDYFSKNKKVLVAPKKIPGTSYYFEGNMNADRLNSIANRLLEKFGYDRESEFEVVLEQKEG